MQGVGQQGSRQDFLVSIGLQPPEVTLEGANLPRKVLTLGASLVMMQVPQPALVYGLSHQRLPGLVQCPSEPIGQRRHMRWGAKPGQPFKESFLIPQQLALLLPRGGSGGRVQQPIIVISGLVDGEQLSLDEVNERYRDVPMMTRPMTITPSCPARSPPGAAGTYDALI